jgi:hypothetical protein
MSDIIINVDPPDDLGVSVTESQIDVTVTPPDSVSVTVDDATAYVTVATPDTMSVSVSEEVVNVSVNPATEFLVMTGTGVPIGGATGQVLAKRSDADNDVEWADGGSGPSVSGYSYFPGGWT